ncbi:AAA family ATPase [Pendulispora brunnea]|uniref:AAA family ATPase n=1 Tax=Pendulispora brunnea TaxID=2905690 RepID=A0ABZ2KFP8_9BACT
MLIYRGRRASDGRAIAAKILRSAYPTTRDIAKLRHEYTILSTLSLDNVVRVHDLEQEDGRFAIIMDDVRGDSLAHLLRARRLSFEQSLGVACALAGAVAAIHGQGILHKDIKPSNVLVDPSGFPSTSRVTLIDFGIATRLSQEARGAEPPGTLEGTLAYMAPEQTGRMNRGVDARADLYSLGVTLYELFAFALPFVSADPMELVHSHIARLPRALHEAAPEVPRAISDIVMRLLRKVPEERYQSAAGVRADLDACLAEWRTTGTIAPFVLATHDHSSELRIPQKLYGRDSEAAALLVAFDRVVVGRPELLLVAGYSGVGKSALVNEIHKPIARRRGYFVSGKFDQFDRSVPYAPITHAFRELVRQVLTERDEALAVWRQRLSSALGSNGQVIVDRIPELELVIGPQPAVPELAAAESQNRFVLVFQNFVRVFCSGDRPLVVFLDDLQWADPASLQLIRHLLTDPEGGHLLLIGAYRDNEVGSTHLLSLALAELRAASAADTKVRSIALGPLELGHVAELLADTLRCTCEEATPLARAALDKTQGNPFFLTQFIRSLHERGLVVFDAKARQWTWDLGAIDRMMVTDNVVDFIVEKLRRLGPETQRVLTYAACIGHSFSLALLAELDERPPADVAADLWDALREGLVLPQDAEYRFFDGPATALVRAETADGTLDVRYRFLHDRVQQAADSLVGDEVRRAHHLKLGRLLRGKLERQRADEDLFEVVRHLNFAAGDITSEGERVDLGRLNLTAARRAKAATAYAAAAAFAASGMAMLTESSWKSDYDLAFALHTERAECEYLIGQFDVAEPLFDRLLERANAKLERARVHNLRIVLYTTLGKFADAIDVGRAGLAVFGIDMPQIGPELDTALGAELADVETNLGPRRIADLVDAPLLTDPDRQAVLRLLMSQISAAYLTHPALLGWVIVKQVNISLRYGHSDVSSCGYMMHGLVLAGVMGRYEQAQEFGRLALALNERFKNVDLTCKLNFMYGVFLFFRQPLRTSLEYSQRAYAAGLESGDFPYLSYTCYSLLMGKLGLGVPLEELVPETDRFLTLMGRTKDAMATAFLRAGRQMLANLRGETHGSAPDALDDASFREEGFAARMIESGFLLVVLWYYIVKLQLRFLYEDYAGALEMAELAESNKASSTGHFFKTELPFYASLTATALLTDARAEDAPRYRALLETNATELAIFAANAPENYGHKDRLVSAERARLDGDHGKAAELYDEAIALAQRNGFARDHALANELASKFYAARGRTTLARAYMTEAHFDYTRWGAIAKVEDLERRYQHLLLRSDAIVETGGVSSRHSTSSTRSTTGDVPGSGRLDVATVVRAAHAISGELVLDRVLERLLRIVLANAGAQRGSLLLQRDGKLLVEAVATVNPDVVQVGLGSEIGTASDLATTVVHYVARTRESVVLADAGADPRFTDDPHIAAARPRSLLCVPMAHQGRLTGVLYLENSLVTGVFDRARVELLQVLSAQAATAVENALLYAAMQAATARLSQANETLEQQVAQRTEELRKTVADLWSEIDLARKIQTVLLPGQPALSGYDVAAVMVPASDVGGDYYDVFRASGTEWVVVGDVSGHGIPAGLIMMMAQTAVRALAQHLGSDTAPPMPSEVLAAVNAAIYRNLRKIGDGQYMTATAFRFDGGTDGAVWYAGLHLDILVYRAAKGEVEVIETTGVWLGVLEDIRTLIPDARIVLEPGDVMLLFTDGLTEARREGQLRGLEPVIERLTTAAPTAESARALVESVLDDLAGCEVSDDVTVVALRRTANARGGDDA